MSIIGIVFLCITNLTVFQFSFWSFKYFEYLSIPSIVFEKLNMTLKFVDFFVIIFLYIIILVRRFDKEWLFVWILECCTDLVTSRNSRLLLYLREGSLKSKQRFNLNLTKDIDTD